MARRCHVGLGPRLIETISSSADGPLNDALQLIYFCRDHPNRLKPNAMQKCYICGHLWREIDNRHAINRVPELQFLDGP